MTAETGIRFTSPGITDEGEEGIFFLEGMPWQFNRKEKALTEDSLQAICKKYSDELSDEDDILKPEYLDFTFSG